MKSSLFCVAFSFLIGISAANGQVVTWNLTGNAGNPGSFGNTLNFSNGGVGLKTTAWSYSFGSSDNAFEAAGLGQYSTGLGVSDVTEGLNAGDPSHQVDNDGVDNFVLFVFDRAVDIDSVRIDPYNTWDRDATYWVGNVSPTLNLSGKTYSNLASLGFQAATNSFSTASSSARDVSLADPSFGNAILFGAYVDGPGSASSGDVDRFKIASITATVPEPSSILVAIMALLPVALMRKRKVS